MHECDMTHSCVSRDVFICATWLIYMRDMTHLLQIQFTATHCNTLQHTATHCNTLQHTATHCNTLQHTARHDSSIHVAWLIYVCDVTHSYDSCSTYYSVIWVIHILLSNTCHSSRIVPGTLIRRAHIKTLTIICAMNDLICARRMRFPHTLLRTLIRHAHIKTLIHRTYYPFSSHILRRSFIAHITVICAMNDTVICAMNECNMCDEWVS